MGRDRVEKNIIPREKTDGGNCLMELEFTLLLFLTGGAMRGKGIG